MKKRSPRKERRRTFSEHQSSDEEEEEEEEDRLVLKSRKIQIRSAGLHSAVASASDC